MSEQRVVSQLSGKKLLATLQTIAKHKANAWITPPSLAAVSEGTNASNSKENSRKAAIKDNIATKNFPTTCASGVLEKYRSPFNATVIDELECSQDAKEQHVVTGKTNLDEFGMGSFSINSRFGEVSGAVDVNTEGHPNVYTVGGSSGGSAWVAATRQAHVALGTDTGGSVRLPAAYTSSIGFKPSYGRLSRWGVVPYANSLDTVGLLSSGFDNLMTAYHQLDQYDRKDPTSLSLASRRRLDALIQQHNVGRRQRRPLKELRIGVPAEYNLEGMSDEVRQGWLSALKELERLGHEIIHISLPSTKHALSAYYVLSAAEAASNLAKYDGVRYGSRAEEGDQAHGVLFSETRRNFGLEVKNRILLGNYTLSSQAMDNYFIQAQKVRRLVQRDFDRVFALPNGLRDPEQIDLSDLDDNIELENKKGPAQVDLIVCPTAPTTAPRLETVHHLSAIDGYMNDVLTVPASLAGLPALSLPIRRFPDMSPSVQVIGQYWDDALVIDLSRSLYKRLHKTPKAKPMESSPE